MKLQEINWPVFRLGEREPLNEAGVLYYVNESINNDTNELRLKVRFIDDKSVEGASLGLRRLTMKENGAPLHIINKAVYYVGDLIKLAKSTTWFIDNSGHPFQYKKSVRAKLTCHRVKKVLPAKGMGAVVELDGLPSRFKTLFAPQPSQHYAGVLHLGLGSILYGFYETQFKQSTRAV